MKYAKKMKLVELDDSNISSYAVNNNRIDDETYSKPYVLSSLDNTMNEILKAPMSDGDKWQLYSQALHRYLNHLKHTSRKIDSNFSYPKNSEEKDPFNVSLHSLDSIRNTFGTTSRRDAFEMSGVDTIRDSLDTISQPTVRNFFENARTALDSSPPKVRVTRRSTSKLNGPLKTRRKNAKRRAENSLSQDLSQIRPCKVVLNEINWKRTRAR